MKVRKVLLIIVLVVTMVLTITLSLFNKDNKKGESDLPKESKSIVENVSDVESIPDGYIGIAYSNFSPVESLIKMFESFVYKINNDDGSSYYEYIAVNWSTKSWGSTEYEKVIDEKGEIHNIDELIKYLKSNAYGGYVAVPGEEEGKTFDEFKTMLEKNN